ncbi:ER membrane DUF1077 domain protein, putative [Cordyceps militaris CM01]|uniref:ER membrane protein complex subunit 4 n=2 Tax=Cordyceps militaris TaxID=73501 RepID=G3JDP8_CORMM|nr:ER membrane DUF1077 domain protein, putative [Cordyceps militaris CM01]ATY64552.1 ER membrane DUF1077 domain [Cordyceps militaris]EGX92723.1 ER membrane DUF1077 domain protein, putative [Cordyceps militaris CM01]
MASSTLPVPQWVQQLQSPPTAKSKAPGIVDPPGFAGSGGNKVRASCPALAATNRKQKDSKIAPRKPPTHDEMDTLKLKKAWEVALAPAKALPMTLIMMYMSGNSLQIFSIMMVFMAFKNPVMGLVNTNQAFERFQTETNSGKILQTKLVYVAMQLGALALGIWKINGMGLLPTTRSDWLMWEAQREAIEHAIPAL